MIFANSKSNHNNRDTNYLTDKQKQINIENNNLYQDKADEFKKWFKESYNKIVKDLKRLNVFNEEVLNDTYIKLYELQLHKGTIQQYQYYFIRSYYTNYFQDERKRDKHIAQHHQLNSLTEDKKVHKPTTLSDKNQILDDSFQELEEQKEITKKQKEIMKNIFDYVYNKFDLIPFELFKIYMSCRPLISYKVLSRITGINQSKISNYIKEIKKDIAENFKITNDYHLLKI